MERNNHNIDVEILQRSINLILDHVKNDLHVNNVKISEDRNLYWTIGLDETFDLKVEPKELNIGSISDDFEFLRDMIESAEDSYDAPALMLEHVAGVLRVLAVTVRG